MARLEDLTRGAQVKGLHPDGPVTIVDATWHDGAVTSILAYQAPGGPCSSR